MHSLVALLAALLLGVIIGFVLARGMHEAARAAPISTPPASRAKDNPNEFSGVAARASANVQTRSTEGHTASATPGQDTASNEPPATKSISNYYTAWQTAMALTDATRREERLTAIAAAWAPDEPLAFVTTLAALKDTVLQQKLWDAVVPALMKADPRGTIDLLRLQPLSRRRDYALTTALRNLALREPELALTLAQTLDEHARADAQIGIVGAWTSVDPAAALAWFNEADPTIRQAALPVVAQSYAKRDAERALVWLLSQDDLDQRRAVGLLAAKLAKVDPRRTAELIDTLARPATRDAAGYAIARQWVQRDPEAVPRWGETFENERIDS